MKKIVFYTIVLFSAAVIFSACGTTRSAAEKAQLAGDIQYAIESSNFTFKANHAYPMSFRSIHLPPTYEVKVTPDTVVAHLPFYGRAYSAPMNPNEGGYHFTSTDFEYEASSGTREGSWTAKITFRDLDRTVTFQFNTWKNGSSKLSVSDVKRQSISFQGEIEPAAGF